MKKEQGISTRYTSSGITLIALVITIIVLLILAGVSISLVVGENGILNQATQSVNENERAEEEEKVKLAAAAAVDTKDLKVKRDALDRELSNYFGSDYTLVDKDGYFEITINSSGRQYKVDSYGNVTAINSDEDEVEDGTGDYTDSTKAPTSITIGSDNYTTDGYGISFEVPYDIYYGEGDISEEIGEIILIAYDENGNQLGKDEVEWTSVYSGASVETGEDGKGIVWLSDTGGTIKATSKYNSEVYAVIHIWGSFTSGPTSITIDSNGTNQMIEGEGITLYALDENGVRIEGPEVIWTSSDTSIATVNEDAAYGEYGIGAVLGCRTGTATIRATSAYNSNIYDEITVKVIGAYVNFPSSISIEITSGSAEMSVGDRLLLEAYDESGVDLIVDYDIEVYSDDESIAKAGQVDGNTAYVDAISPGTVDIIVKSVANPTVYETLTVTVTE